MFIKSSFLAWCMEDYTRWMFLVTVAIITWLVCHSGRKANQGKEGSKNKTNIHDGLDACEVDSESEGEFDSELSPLLPADTQHIPYALPRTCDSDMVTRANEFYQLMNGRRTVRIFSSDPIPDEVIRQIVMTASTSPSGAHTQPWTFVVVKDPNVKSSIREIVEDEERVNYQRRMAKQWKADLKPLKTQWRKPYLTAAPVLLLVFRQANARHYYSEMSVAIATGILITAIHYAGLVALTSTPLHCGGRLRQFLNRPASERLALLLPVGKIHPNCTVPDLKRKSYEEICVEM